MQDRVRRLGVLVAGAFVVVVASACSSGTVSPSATAPTTTSAAAATTTEAEPTTEAAPTTTAAAASRPLARVFPDVDAPTCVPSAEAGGSVAVRTSGGATPVEAYTCDYSATVPGARVVFTEWASEADARAWYQDTAALGPRIENNDAWTVAGNRQGDLYTAQQGGGGIVFSTGLYDGQPYGWEIQTATLDESNTVFGALTLQAASAFSG